MGSVHYQLLRTEVHLRLLLRVCFVPQLAPQPGQGTGKDLLWVQGQRGSLQLQAWRVWMPAGMRQV